MGLRPEKRCRGAMSRVPTLLEELLDQAQRYAKSLRNLGPRALMVVVRGEDSFPQIK